MAPHRVFAFGMSIVNFAGSESSFSVGSASTSASSPELSWVPELDFHGQPYRDLVATDLPLKACTVHQSNPPLFQSPPVLWQQPFVRTRFRMSPDHKPEASFWSWKGSSRMMVRQVLPQRAFCKLLSEADRLSPFSWLRPGLICTDCSSHPCSKAAAPVFGTSDFAVDLPASSGGACVLLDSLPTGVSRLRVTWERRYDPSVLIYLLLGTLLVTCHSLLQESILLHAALGGLGSLGVVVIVVCYWFFSSARGAINGTANSLPLGGLLTSCSMFLLVLIPSLREALISIVIPDGSSDLWAWLNLRDPVLDLPLGWIVLISGLLLALTVISMGARWSLRFFASAPEPEGDVPFEIGSDGRRVDSLPSIPWPQRCLGWLIWQAGFWMLLESTYVDTCSLALTGIVIFKDYIIHGLSSAAGNNGEDPAYFRPLVDPQTFEAEGRRYTAEALNNLQRHLRAYPSQMDCVSKDNDTELRLRRFSQGRSHFEHPSENSLACLERPRRWCSIL